MKVQILMDYWRGEQTLIITPLLRNGHYYPGKGLHCTTDNPVKSLEELIQQLQEYLNKIKN